MKMKLVPKILCLFFCSIFFVSAISAQEKPQALKFDEFDDVVENQFYTTRYADSDKLNFEERIERFVKQLENERGGRAYVIYYQARIGYQRAGWQQNFVNRLKEIKSSIEYNDRIKIKDVVIIDGGYRENNSAEFWIVPENADLPAPTPDFDRAETYVCPAAYVYGTTKPNADGTIRFYVRDKDYEQKFDYPLTWRVFGGEIVSGQGTSDIEVKPNDSVAGKIAAYVEINSLPFPCPKVYSGTTKVNATLLQIDEFGRIANGDLKARMDNFYVELNNNPAAKGYIIIYGSRAERGRDTQNRTNTIKNYSLMRRFDMNRMTIINGGYREKISTELWLSFDDAAKPVLTRTVDEKFIAAPKPTVRRQSRKK